jgi:hypothetical protein
MASDSRFVSYLHRNVVLDVVDDEWRRETLPDDGMRAACAHLPGSRPHARARTQTTAARHSHAHARTRACSRAASQTSRSRTTSLSRQPTVRMLKGSDCPTKNRRINGSSSGLTSYKTRDGSKDGSSQGQFDLARSRSTDDVPLASGGECHQGIVRAAWILI